MKTQTKQEIVQELKTRGYKTSFRTKKDAQQMLDSILWYEHFPWHDDQKVILQWGIQEKKESVVQGVFGSGKTTVMMGIFSKLVQTQQVQAPSIMFCAFNVSIRNELKKKLKQTGLKKRPTVRTFDSLVYELCRHHGMTGLEKPDYEGRRFFLERLLEQSDPTTLSQVFFPIRVLLVDETQDLDYKSHRVFQSFFPNAHIFFFGDIFQCIQKEPRSSLLWHVLQPEETRQIHFMQKTPRVPTTILQEIKRALIHHYPEYTAPISNWYSSNPLSHSKIEWVAIQHYNHVFDHLVSFLQKYPPEKCMVLTFSSAITVRGNMGDLCRFRQFLQKKNYIVNRNYKSMDHDKLFLSTVNSSKGLERPYVFIALTFPLELAFANFSNDLVVNLVSVGLSRCKEHVVFCVPTYSDRFSDVLHLYPECPKPEKNSVSNKKYIREEPDGLQDILHRSHSTTEILRQGMLTYQTRDLLRSCAKYVGNNPFPPGDRVRWSMRNEEEASFMGILYEVLITSLWTQRWPELDVGGMTEIRNNPMYTHCRQNIDKGFQKLVSTFRKPYYCNFNILYEYTEYHILLSQKIRVRISKERKEEMCSVWQRLRKDITSLNPHFPVMRAQVNLKGSFMTGVADLICRKGEDDQDIVLYEIKTCSQSDWKEEAFTQASLYMSMTKYKKGTIRLLNPFRRELYEYQICLQSKEKQVLTQVGRELLLWNFNCFLAKHENNVLMPPLSQKIQQYLIGQEETYLEFLASTKARITPFPDNKTVIDPCQKNIFFNGDRADRLEWLLEQLQYKKKDEQERLPEISKDPFYVSVLTGVYIRKSYCFR